MSDAPLKHEPSLARTFQGAFEVGCAVGGTLPESLSEAERLLLTRHFTGLTPENCMKPGPIQPAPGEYDFAQADALVRFAADHQQRVVGHTLCWHQQSPDWFFEDIERSIEEYAALGLKVMFTELDLDVIDRPDCSADLAVQREYTLTDDSYRAGCLADVLERQATQYAELFRLFARQKPVTRVTIWGLNDGRSWLNSWPGTRTNHPLLFDRQCRPKPAFWRVVELSQRRA